jgi:hypothetical protein
MLGNFKKLNRISHSQHEILECPSLVQMRVDWMIWSFIGIILFWTMKFQEEIQLSNSTSFENSTRSVHYNRVEIRIEFDRYGSRGRHLLKIVNYRTSFEFSRRLLNKYLFLVRDWSLRLFSTNWFVLDWSHDFFLSLDFQELSKLWSEQRWYKEVLVCLSFFIPT